MHTNTLEQAVAKSTGEDVTTIRRLGFYIILEFGEDPLESPAEANRREAQEYFNTVFRCLPTE